MSLCVQRLEEGLADDLAGKRLRLEEIVKRIELRQTERISVRYRLPEALTLGKEWIPRAWKR